MPVVTFTGGGKTPEPLKLTDRLRRLVDRRDVRGRYGGDSGSEYGADFARGPWVRPEWVDPREQAEARAALPAAEAAARPASLNLMNEFLTGLWSAARHPEGMTYDTVLRVYPMILEGFPVWCFRREKLKSAALSFEFFPAVAKLAEFLAPDRQWLLEEIEGLRGVANAPTEHQAGRAAGPGGAGSEAGGFKWSKEIAEEYGRKMSARINAQRERDYAALMTARSSAEAKP